MQQADSFPTPCDQLEAFISNTLHKKFVKKPLDNDEIRAGMGRKISVKVVIPTHCQARCPFCFNRLTIHSQRHDEDAFFMHLTESLDYIMKTLRGRVISLDLTGNEPTFNPALLQKLMMVLKHYKDSYPDKIDKVIMSTNGYRLGECIDIIRGVVDIVNISLHDEDYAKRVAIFGTSQIPDNEELVRLNASLHEAGIASTSVTVVYEHIDMAAYVPRFAAFSRRVGFNDTRVRIDCIPEDLTIKQLFAAKIENERTDYKRGMKYLDADGFHVAIIKGVPALIDYLIGIEGVIDDDGRFYIDYYKQYPMGRLFEAFNDALYFVTPTPEAKRPSVTSCPKPTHEP